MNLPVSFHRAAQAEFDEAVAWYETQRTGLGRDFIGEIERSIALIAQNPERYPVVYRNIRRNIIRRFPYSLLYRVEPQRIILLAVFHASRDPAIWQTRR